MTFILETGQYFGTFQNEINDKKSGTEGVLIFFKLIIFLKKKNYTMTWHAVVFILFY